MKMYIRAVAILLFSSFLLTQCRTDPKPSEEVVVDYERISNEVIVASASEADNLNPILTTSGYSKMPIDYMFQSLLAISPQDLELIPLLAESRPTAEEREDGSIAYTFDIREEAVWSNGSPVTADDVVFTLKTALNPRVAAGHIRNNLTVLKEVITYADNPKRITLVANNKYIRNEAVLGGAYYVIPAYNYDADRLLADVDIADLIDPERAEQAAASNPNLQAFADQFINPKFARASEGVVGSGAYELISFETGQGVTIKRKENWWGEGLAAGNIYFDNNVETVTYLAIGDANAQEAAVRNEQIDVISGMTPDIYNDLSADEQVMTVYDAFAGARAAWGFWNINTKNPKLSDKRVRRALAHVVDVDAILENVLDMPLKRITTSVLPDMPGYDDSLQPIELDIEKAKTLLAEAGWTDTNNNGIVDKEIDGELVEMNLEILTVNSRQTQEDAGLLVKEDAIQAGINLEVIPQEPTTQRQRMMSRDYELATGAIPEPTPSTYDPFQMWHTTSDNPSGFNRVGFGDSESDALIEKIQVTLDQEERNELYEEFQQLLYEEQPMIFLYQLPNFFLVHKRFNAKSYGLSPNFFPGSFELENLVEMKD
ncbi:MAG: ABC transporter substrate-binding protein [Bacteroidota bacterium]